MTNQAAPGATVEAKRPWLLRYAIYSSIFAGWMVLIFFVTGGRSDPMWLAHWQRWDANWYEQIWSAGYRSDPKTLAFPPAYPYLMGIVAKIFSKSFLGTAVVLNLFAFFAAAAVISDWLSRKFGVSPYSLCRRLLLISRSRPIPTWSSCCCYGSCCTSRLTPKNRTARKS